MRYLRLRARLNEMHEAFPDIGLVVYEQTLARVTGRAVSMTAAEYAMGCATHVQSWCAEKHVQHTAVHAATLKKHATGKGNSDKAAMMAAARARGWQFKDDNEADALWIFDYASTPGNVL